MADSVRGGRQREGWQTVWRALWGVADSVRGQGAVWRALWGACERAAGSVAGSVGGGRRWQTVRGQQAVWRALWGPRSEAKRE